MKNSELMNSVCKQVKSTANVNVEYSQNGVSGRPVPMFIVDTKVNDYKLKFDMEFTAIYDTVAGNGDVDSIHEYFLSLLSDSSLNNIIDYQNDIHDNPELKDNERTTLHDYLRDFFISLEVQLTDIAEKEGIEVESIFK